MKLNRLTEHCWYTDPDPASDRPSLGYILGSNGKSIAVDTGNSRKHFREFTDLLRESGLPYPEYCVITHWHWDHTLGINEVRSLVFACQKTQDHLLKLKKMDKRAMWESNEYLRVEYPKPGLIDPGTADIVFRDSVIFNLGNITVKAIHIEGPHSDDSVIVYVKEDGVIFAGDSSAGNFDLPNIAYDRELLKKYTEYILGLDFRWFLHQHRPPTDRKATELFLDRAMERGYYTFD